MKDCDKMVTKRCTKCGKDVQVRVRLAGAAVTHLDCAMKAMAAMRAKQSDGTV